MVGRKDRTDGKKAAASSRDVSIGTIVAAAQTLEVLDCHMLCRFLLRRLRHLPIVDREVYARYLIHRLDRVEEVAEFHDVLHAHGILGSDKRFMHVEMDISNKCNLRCRMCYFSQDSRFSEAPVFLSPERFSQIAEALFHHAHTLTLSLGNEPLTSPHFISILRIASRYEIPKITFFTNGQLLNDEIIDAIIDNRVTQVAVSVDGATKDTFEYIRQGANFERLLGNIDNLNVKKSSTGNKFPTLSFYVVMMKRNIRELEAIVTLASQLGVSELNFTHMVVWEELAIESESLVNDKELSNYWLNRALAKASDCGLVVVGHPTPFRIDSHDDLPGRRSSPSVFARVPYCHYPFFHVSINAGGHFLPCPFSHGEAPFGCVSEDMPTDEIWFGEQFKDLRKRILRRDPPTMCKRCSFLAIKHSDVKEFFAPRSPSVVSSL